MNNEQVIRKYIDEHPEIQKWSEDFIRIAKQEDERTSEILLLKINENA